MFVLVEQLILDVIDPKDNTTVHVNTKGADRFRGLKPQDISLTPEHELQ